MPLGAQVNISSVFFCLLFGYRLSSPPPPICSLNTVYGLERVARVWKPCPVFAAVAFERHTWKRTHAHRSTDVPQQWICSANDSETAFLSCNCDCVFCLFCLQRLCLRGPGALRLFGVSLLSVWLHCAAGAQQSSPIGMQRTRLHSGIRRSFIGTYFSTPLSTIRGVWVALASG